MIVDRGRTGQPAIAATISGQDVGGIVVPDLDTRHRAPDDDRRGRAPTWQVPGTGGDRDARPRSRRPAPAGGGRGRREDPGQRRHQAADRRPVDGRSTGCRSPTRSLTGVGTTLDGTVDGVQGTLDGTTDSLLP